MAQDKPTKTLKSVSGGAPLRSRGFLSQPGGQPPQADTGCDPTEAGKRHRSRGARQASVSAGGKPENLVPRPGIRPYTLEDE